MSGGAPGRSAFTDFGTITTGRLVVRDVLLYTFVSGIALIWIVFAITLSLSVDDPATPEDESMTEDTTSLLMSVFVVMTVVDIIIAFLRYRTWAVLVRDGVVVPGTVTSIKQVSQGAWVDVSYLFEGREVPKKRMLGGLVPRFGMRLSEGQEVTLLVDGRRPERHIILDLYIKPRA